MIPTLARFSKASRAPLTPKRGNKDFYKGTRQAFLPGGRRTGAPGKHVVRGSAKYRLVDSKVRVFVAPPVQEIEDSKLRPYVALGTKLTQDQENAVLSKFRGPRGLTPEHFLRIAREHTYARRNPDAPLIPSSPTQLAKGKTPRSSKILTVPNWLRAQVAVGLRPPTIGLTPADNEKKPLIVDAATNDPEAAEKKLHHARLAAEKKKTKKKSLEVVAEHTHAS